MCTGNGVYGVPHAYLNHLLCREWAYMYNMHDTHNIHQPFCTTQMGFFCMEVGGNTKYIFFCQFGNDFQYS